MQKNSQHSGKSTWARHQSSSACLAQGHKNYQDLARQSGVYEDMPDKIYHLKGGFAGNVAGIQGIQQLLLPLVEISLDVGIIIALATADDGTCAASYHCLVDLPSHSTEVLVLSVPQAEHSKLQAL